MTQLLTDDIVKQVKDVFDSRLSHPIEMLFFEQEEDCDYCEDTRQLLQEVSAISDRITMQGYDLKRDAALAKQYKVDKAPGIVIAGKDGGQILDYGIRFAGIPSGHEFASLIQGLVLVSGRDSGLSPEARQELANLVDPVHLQVFVTPTCPYCPRAVVLAHQMALESPMVEAEAVEAMEFQELAGRFGVSGVPQTSINQGAGTIVGAVPEAHLLEEIKQALASTIKQKE